MSRIQTFSQLLAAAGIHPLDSLTIPSVSISSLTDDSRKVLPGACFVAVPGTRTNGASFVEQVRLKGAAAVIGGPDLAEIDLPAVRLADPRRALSKLAAAYFGLSAQGAPDLKLIGVTGTNGKTTVTWLLRSILHAAGKKAAMLGTVEYDLITQKRPAPLTTPGAIELCESLAAARDAGADYAVFEVSSHALDQGRCEGLTFSAGVFTNLTGDHLDYHVTMDAYAAAKKKLFQMLPSNAVAIINADDCRGGEFAAASAALARTYGIESLNADVRGDLALLDRAGTSFVLATKELRVPIRIPLAGKHNVANALAAATTALSLGIPLDSVREGLQNIEGVPGRLQRVEPENCPFSIFVDYAHTDDALCNVLTALRPLTPGHLICVFGCGGDRDRTKRPRMASVVSELADVAWVTSDNPRTESASVIIDEILAGFPRDSGCRIESEVDRRQAILAAIGQARQGDTVLIAGKGHESYQLIGDRVLQFNDVEVAREALDLRADLKKPALQEEVA